MAEVDPVTAERMVALLETMARSTSDIADHYKVAEQRANELNERMGKAPEVIDKSLGALGKYKSVMTHTVDEFGKNYKRFIHVDFLQGTEDALRRAGERWRAYGAEVQRHLTQARGGLGGAGAATGVTSLFGGGKSAISGLTNQLPFGMGGLIGLMLYGQKRKEEFDASAVQVSRVMDQFGQGGAAAAAVRGRVEMLHRELGTTGEELKGVIDQFASFGLGAEIFNKTDKDAKEMGKDLAGVVAALEMANRLGPGTLAAKMGEVFEAGGTDRKKLLDDFFALDEMAQKTGVSVDRMTSVFTQSVSSLRTQRQGVSDLTGSYAKLFNSLSSGAMRGAGVQATGAAALRGLQAAAGGIGGLNEGMLAEISRRMGGPEGVGGIVAMREGMSGKGRFSSGEVFKELGRLAKEIAPDSRENQIFALEKIAPSLGFEGARAVIDMMSGGETLKGVKEAIKSPQEKIAEALQRRQAEQSPWETAMRKILVDMAKIGGATLNILMSQLGAVIQLLSGEKPDISKMKETQDKSLDDMADAFRGMIKAAGDGAGLELPDFLKNHGKGRRQDASAPNRDIISQVHEFLDERVTGEERLPPALKQGLTRKLVDAAHDKRNLQDAAVEFASGREMQGRGVRIILDAKIVPPSEKPERKTR